VSFFDFDNIEFIFIHLFLAQFYKNIREPLSTIFSIQIKNEDKGFMKIRIGAIMISSSAAIMASFSYIAILAKDSLGTDELFISILYSSYYAMAFFSSYCFGRLGDIHSRRTILYVGLFFSTFSFGLLWIASTPEIVFIVRTLNGLSVGMYPGTLAAYAYESDLEMGKFASFGAVGWAIGTLVAGYAAEFDIRYAFLTSAVFFAIAFVTALSLPSVPGAKMKIPLFPIATFKRNISVYVTVFIRHSSASAVWTFWSLHLTDLGGNPFMIGVMWTINSISQVIFMAIIGDRFNSNIMIISGLIFTALSFSLVLLATTIIEIIPSQIVMGLAWSCIYVGSLKRITQENEEKATASGLLSSIVSLSGIIGPVYTAILFSIWPSYFPIFGFCIVMSGVALVFYEISKRKFPVNLVDL
jgi:MFS family permease